MTKTRLELLKANYLTARRKHVEVKALSTRKAMAGLSGRKQDRRLLATYEAEAERHRYHISYLEAKRSWMCQGVDMLSVPMVRQRRKLNIRLTKAGSKLHTALEMAALHRSELAGS